MVEFLIKASGGAQLLATARTIQYGWLESFSP